MNNDCGIKEETGGLYTVSSANADVAHILEALRADDVVLVRGASSEDADRLIAAVTDELGLRSQLDIQSAFASVHGHRSNVGKYFMSVNKRSDYQYIPAHSEGGRISNMQLASLYCYENTTDGGESILMNVDSESTEWEKLRSLTRKVDLCGRTLSASEVAAAKMIYQISFPENLLTGDDQILAEQPSPVPGVKLYTALSKPMPTYSSILGREVMVYWDDIASTDFDSGEGFFRLVKTLGLLKEPPGGVQIGHLDNAHSRRVWRSGMLYEKLFQRKITHKLCGGDLLIQNNLTWTHSTANWTPNSGIRKVVAAFA